MMNWKKLTELYEASKSEDPKIRTPARVEIDAHIDAWVTEYLALPENQARFDSYERLAQWVTCWLVHGPGGWEAYQERCEQLKSDRLGILLRNRKLDYARKLHANDWNCATLYGERFMLGLTPAPAPGDPAPQLQEFGELPD